MEKTNFTFFPPIIILVFCDKPNVLWSLTNQWITGLLCSSRKTCYKDFFEMLEKMNGEITSGASYVTKSHVPVELYGGGDNLICLQEKSFIVWIYSVGVAGRGQSQLKE